jgi:hypothetical protein
MKHDLSRRDFVLALLAATAAPIAVTHGDVPAGSARYLIELLAFRPPGAAPKVYPVPDISSVGSIPGRIEPLTATDYQMTAAATALASKGGYRVLGHAAWAAIVPPNGRTTTHLEEVLPSGSPLSGLLAIQRSQYLFLGLEVDYATGDQTYGLREKRRIKFGERHYFDHPAFGLIALVTPGKGTPAVD